MLYESFFSNEVFMNILLLGNGVDINCGLPMVREMFRSVVCLITILIDVRSWLYDSFHY